MKKQLIKRPKNKNQILKETDTNNLRLKIIINNLRKENNKLRKQNHELSKEKRLLKLQIRIANFETIPTLQ
jgi:hypothetical protein